MRQVWITKAGPPEVLQVREANDPFPAPDQVRVRTHAAGVNFADTSARMGLYPDAPPIPCVVGYEVSGVIDKVGDQVTTHKIGDRVIAMTQFGGYSDLVCVPAHQAVPMPDEMTFDEGAALPVVYLTAYHMLVYLGNVKAGDTVLIHAAAGGVGLAALQLCKAMMAKTIGTASAHKHGFLLDAGLDHAIDYNNEDFEAEVMRYTEGRGVDIALDAQGGDSLAKSYRCLAPTGRVFAFGAASFQSGVSKKLWNVIKGVAETPVFHPLPMMNDNRGVFGVNVGHLWNEIAILRREIDALIALYKRGQIKPVIDLKVPFDQAAEAHRRLAERKNIGKVLLIP